MMLGNDIAFVGNNNKELQLYKPRHRVADEPWETTTKNYNQRHRAGDPRQEPLSETTTKNYNGDEYLVCSWLGAARETTTKNYNGTCV